MTGTLAAVSDRVYSVVLAGALAAVVGLAVNGSVPVFWLAFVVPLAALGVAAHLRTPRFLPLAALALAVAPMPVFVPILLPMGGRSLFILDLVLPAVALWSLAGARPSPGADRAATFYGFVAMILCAVGVLRGAAPNAVFQDLRGPLYLLCGYVIVSRRLRWPDRRPVLALTSGILWWSVAAIALSLATGRELLRGRVGETAAFVGDGKEQLDAIRFLIASKELAIVAVLTSIGLLVLGGRGTTPRRLVLGFLAPAGVVVFMGFSRQSLVALAAGIVYLVLVSPLRTRTVTRVLSGFAIVAIALVALGMAGFTERFTSEDTVLGRQVNAYSDRVLGGLSADNATEDPGNQFRTMENEAAIDFARRHPVAGGGFGTAYRGDLELEAFSHGDLDYGRRYVHNVYLWYAAHGGIIGVAGIAVLLGRPLVRGIWPAFRGASAHRTTVLSLGAAYVGLLVIGLVEPVIHTNATAPLTGALLGIFAHLEGDRRARRSSAAADRASSGTQVSA